MSDSEFLRNAVNPLRALERHLGEHGQRAMNVVMSQELPKPAMLEAIRDDSGRQRVIDAIAEQGREAEARENESLELVRESVELARRSEERAVCAEERERRSEERAVRAEEREQQAGARARRANFISWCALLVAVASLVFASVFFWLGRVL